MVVVGSLLAECLLELPAQSVVVRGELPDACGCGLEAALQRRLGGALPRGDRARGWSPAVVAEALDLGSDVGLGVEPGPRDLRAASDDLVGDRGTGRIELVQRLDGFAAGELVASLRSGDQVRGVVSPHRLPRHGLVRRRRRGR